MKTNRLFKSSAIVPMLFTVAAQARQVTSIVHLRRMKADGSDQRQMTFDEDLNAWFPHVSPNSRKVVCIACHKGDLRPDQASGLCRLPS